MDLLEEKLGPLLVQLPYLNREKFPRQQDFLNRLAAFLATLPGGYRWVVEIRNRGWLNEQLYSLLGRHGVALALADQAWMPRPAKWFEPGNPVTADFAFIRWLGDRKSIERQTKLWNRTIVDRSGELQEWVETLGTVRRQVKVIFAYANNHYAGYAPDTVELFQKLWKAAQESGVEG